MKKRIMIVMGEIFIYGLICSSTGWTYIAKASWYGSYFHGRTTANGEKYNMYCSSTAAYKTLPFETRVKVTNLRNGQSIVVRINDRGPYIFGREFDLSYAAAKKIDLAKNGVELVKIKVLKAESIFYPYRIRKGNTLWRLFGPNWPIIAQINKVSPRELKPGMKLLVPYHWDEIF